MKALLVLLTVLATSSAFAGVSSMSWGEILSDSSLVVPNDLVFQNGPGYGATWKAATDKNVCHDGSTVYGGTSLVRVCSGSDSSEDCEWVRVKLETPFYYTAKVQKCTGSDDSNCVWTTKTVDNSPNRMMAIYKKPSGSNGNLQYVGKKAYTIPYCADLAPVPAN